MSQRDGNTGAPLFLPSETALYVRFADVDMMQVVHHCAYLHWFEQIRFKFMGDILGVSLDKLRECGIALPLTSCEVNYKQAFRFGQQPLGYARLEVFKQARFTLHYVIRDRATGAIATTGSTTHCFLGPGHKLLLRTPALFSEALRGACLRHPGGVAEIGEVPHA